MNLEKVRDEKEALAIISGVIATPFCTLYLEVSGESVENGKSLLKLMRALYEKEMYREMVLLLKILYNLIDLEIPEVLIQALKEPDNYSALLSNLMLDYCEILEEEISLMQ